MSSFRFYYSELRIKPLKDIIHVLVDIVSKNGLLLLNISSMGDGTIPENQRQVLLELGGWLDVYGKSIYDTRPWITFGEGLPESRKEAFKTTRILRSWFIKQGHEIKNKRNNKGIWR